MPTAHMKASRSSLGSSTTMNGSSPCTCCPASPRAPPRVPPRAARWSGKSDGERTPNSLRRFTNFVERSFSLEDDRERRARARAGAVPWPWSPSSALPERRRLDGKAGPDKELEGAGDFTVDWESGHDPENPVNWSWAKMSVHICLVGTAVFVGSLATAIFSPGVPEMLDEFGSTSELLGVLAVSIYALGWGIAPIILGPLSKALGRLGVYHVASITFAVSALASARAPNLPTLIALRLVAGCAASAPNAVGGGIMADIVPRDYRAKVMSVAVAAPLVGLAVGPMVGGALVEAYGWRSTLYFTAGVGGVLAAASLLFLSETSGSVILERIAHDMRKITKDKRYTSRLADARPAPLLRVLAGALRRPLLLLLTNPVILLLSIYLAVVSAYMFVLMATLPLALRQELAFSISTAGFSYIGLMVGFAAGVGLNATVVDMLSVRRSETGDHRPEARLMPVVFASPLAPAGMALYGWSLQLGLHPAVPIIGTALVGAGMVLTLLSLTTYLVDAFMAVASSAIAALTLVRHLVGASLPLVAIYLSDSLGLGLANTLLAGVSLVLIPVPLFFIWYGERLRNRFDREL